MITNVRDASTENKILAAARMVGEYFCPNYGPHSPHWILVPAIRDLARLNPEGSPIELFERFVAQSESKYRRQLSQYVAAMSTGDLARMTPDAVSIFTGGRRFSFAKLSAMVSFFAAREKPICTQKLNDLLFYSDFTNYYLYDYSISGAKYTRQRSGAAMHRYEVIMKTLLFAGVLNHADGAAGTHVTTTGEPNLDDLSLLELVTMYRVCSDFGEMTLAEIREYSQNESVYRFTPQDDYIPYEYARLMIRLPA